MKWVFMIVGGLLALGLIAYIAMAIQSQKRPATSGVINSQLRPCPASPNCVCSEAKDRTDPEHGVAPIALHADSWAHLNDVIRQQGGVIDEDDDQYLHATFTSALFRFVDDFELRLDPEAGEIQIRSASRAGRSDFGVNRQRVENIMTQIKLLHN